MRKVVIESPYGGSVARNVKYARAALRDCLLRGETPYASHLLYTQTGVLDDTIPEERKLGIEAGFEWRAGAEATVVYIDFGVSMGMKYGIAAAEELRKKDGKHVIEYRTLPETVLQSAGIKK
jgi:hypothetical protein